MAGTKLVLANGAFKSGSTWLRDIVSNLDSFDPIPTSYSRRRLPHWVSSSKLNAFLDDSTASGRYLSKSHIYSHQAVAFLLQRDDVRILNISRDLRDVIVSHYYHFNRIRRSKLDFSKYYRSVGRYKAREIALYNDAWAIESDNLYSTTFERLKSDFASEVKGIASFLGYRISISDVESIAEKTSLENLMKARNEQHKPESQRFFRKGIVGDWKNHFTDAEAMDLANIAENGFQKPMEKIRFYAAFRIRRFLIQHRYK